MIQNTKKEQLHDKILMLKIQLAIIIERLLENRQENFARHLYLNLQKINVELENTNYSNSIMVRRKMKSISGYLNELENILLACKVGIAFPAEEKALEIVRTLRLEVAEIIIQEEVLLN